jgi:serine/threonine protein kinase
MDLKDNNVYDTPYFEMLPLADETIRSDYSTGSFGYIDFVCNGSNSNIYRVKENNESPTWILKVLDDKSMGRHEVKEEFARERIILERMSHPHIVDLKGSGVANMGGWSKPMLLLEYLEGRTLSFHLMNFSGAGNRCFPSVRVLEIASELCNALAFIHYQLSRRWILIHRDLKPDNIGFTANGTVKLMDFGLCVYTERGRHMHDTYQLSGCTGSLRYMAPEVARRERYNEKVDVYSFGLIVYELITGIPPFSGLNRQSFFDQVVNRNLRPPLDISENGHKVKLFPGAAELMNACWAPDYRLRPTTREVLERLHACLEQKQKKMEGEGWLQKKIRSMKGKGPI